MKKVWVASILLAGVLLAVFSFATLVDARTINRPRGNIIVPTISTANANSTVAVGPRGAGPTMIQSIQRPAACVSLTSNCTRMAIVTKTFTGAGTGAIVVGRAAVIAGPAAGLKGMGAGFTIGATTGTVIGVGQCVNSIRQCVIPAWHRR